MARTVFSKIEMRNLNSVVSADITGKVRRFSIKTSLITGCTNWEILLYGENISSEEFLMLDRGVKQFRMTETDGKRETTTDWKLLSVSECSMHYEGSVPFVCVKGSDVSYLLRQKSRFRAFVNRSAFDVMSSILAEYGIGLNALPFLSFDTWYQTGITDWDLLEIIQSETLSSAGQQNIFYSFDGFTMTAKEIDYSKQSTRELIIGDRDDRVIATTFSFFGREVDAIGGDTQISSGFSLQSKKLLPFITTENMMPAIAPYLHSRPTSSNAYKLIGRFDVDKVKNASLFEWMNNAAKYYSVRVQLIADLSIKVRDIIDLKIFDGLGGESAFAGKYAVYEVEHVYNDEESYSENGSVGAFGGITTHLGCYRRTRNEGSIRTTAVDYSNIPTRDKYSIEEKNVDTVVKEVIKIR